MTLAVDEFTRCFLLHVLPTGFHSIRRHYGLLAGSSRMDNGPIARKLLAIEPWFKWVRKRRAAGSAAALPLPRRAYDRDRDLYALAATAG